MQMPLVHEYMRTITERKLLGWLFGFYGISTLVGHLMLNPYIYIYDLKSNSLQEAFLNESKLICSLTNCFKYSKYEAVLFNQ